MFQSPLKRGNSSDGCFLFPRRFRPASFNPLSNGAIPLTSTIKYFLTVP